MKKERIELDGKSCIMVITSLGSYVMKNRKKENVVFSLTENKYIIK